MTRLACLFALLLPAAILAADPAQVAKFDGTPGGAVCVTPDGRTFVATVDPNATTGPVYEIKDGKPTKQAELPRPATGMVAFQGSLFASTVNAVHRVNLGSGKAEVWASAKDFPTEPTLLAGMAVDERGWVYVVNTHGDRKSTLYSIGMRFGPGRPPARGEVKRVADLEVAGPAGGVIMDGMNHALVLRERDILRVKLADGTNEIAAKGYDGAMAFCTDPHGRFYVLGSKGVVYGMPRPGAELVKVYDAGKEGFANGIAFDPAQRRLLLTSGDKTLKALPAVIPGWEVDESPLPIETELAFADVKWTGWDDGSASGKVVPLRPIVLTHANDASGRTFVATQHGVIHIVEKGAKESKVFLDIQSKCLYRDDQNEQGLLGLAFHPDYKKNGEFFVFYTDRAKKLENVVCRFKVSKDDPNKADPASEQELMRISHKYWNHDGGTVAFGPDSFLYIVLGDGGSANDPDDHGQKTDTTLGKILRIDINSKGENTPYGIPKDNPFVGKKEYRPEIFALGVRNPWRLSFDRKTGQGWFGEVGQNLWEEINLLEKGANYGWRRRESLHPFGADGSGPKKEFTDPIWEYHHDVGKSITGGHVYRGKELPELDGMYLYADYVSGKLWGLKYDEKAKRVTANRPIAGKNLPILSFGEDEAGEVYLMTYAANGKGIYKFKATK